MDKIINENEDIPDSSSNSNNNNRLELQCDMQEVVKQQQLQNIHNKYSQITQIPESDEEYVRSKQNSMAQQFSAEKKSSESQKSGQNNFLLFNNSPNSNIGCPKEKLDQNDEIEFLDLDHNNSSKNKNNNNITNTKNDNKVIDLQQFLDQNLQKNKLKYHNNTIDNNLKCQSSYNSSKNTEETNEIDDNQQYKTPLRKKKNKLLFQQSYSQEPQQQQEYNFQQLQYPEENNQNFGISKQFSSPIKQQKQNKRNSIRIAKSSNQSSNGNIENEKNIKKQLIFTEIEERIFKWLEKMEIEWEKPDKMEQYFNRNRLTIFRDRNSSQKSVLSSQSDSIGANSFQNSPTQNDKKNSQFKKKSQLEECKENQSHYNNDFNDNSSDYDDYNDEEQKQYDSNSNRGKSSKKSFVANTRCSIDSIISEQSIQQIHQQQSSGGGDQNNNSKIVNKSRSKSNIVQSMQLLNSCNSILLQRRKQSMNKISIGGEGSGRKDSAEENNKKCGLVSKAIKSLQHIHINHSKLLKKPTSSINIGDDDNNDIENLQQNEEIDNQISQNIETDSHPF